MERISKSFGSELKSRQFRFLKEKSLVLDIVVLKLMLETENKKTAGLFIASEKQCPFGTQRISTPPLLTN